MSAPREERLQLVTDFAELHAGVLVVIKPCDRCSAPSHRGMLIKQHQRPSYIPIGCPSAWEMRPKAAGHYGLCNCVVAEGRVFRVVDDLEDPAEYFADVEAAELLARAGVRPTTRRAPATSRVAFGPERRR